MVFTPLQGAKIIPHPLFGDHPGAAKEARFSVQENAQVSVYHRAIGVDGGTTKVTTVIFAVTNLSSTETITIKPTLDLIDAAGQVLRVMDYRALHDAAVAASGQGNRQQSSFFAFGNQQFVTSAMGGYAVGSIISELASSSRREKASRMALTVEKHWLRDEYRIPPLAYVDAMVALTGLPRLPLTSRITIGDQVFVFSSVSSESEAESNAAIKPN
jgi:hypothetical protein